MLSCGMLICAPHNIWQTLLISIVHANNFSWLPTIIIHLLVQRTDWTYLLPVCYHNQIYCIIMPLAFSTVNLWLCSHQQFFWLNNLLHLKAALNSDSCVCLSVPFLYLPLWCVLHARKVKHTKLVNLWHDHDMMLICNAPDQKNGLDLDMHLVETYNQFFCGCA
jgi:hypothetical protein